MRNGVNRIHHALPANTALEQAREKQLRLKLERQHKELARLRKEVEKAAHWKEQQQKKYEHFSRSRIWKATLPVRFLIDKAKRKQPERPSAGKPSQQNSSGKQWDKYAKHLKHRLYHFGFTEAALRDLHQLLYTEEVSLPLKKFAAKEIGLWHLNTKTAAGAEKYLAMLPKMLEGKNNAAAYRKASILEAESYLLHQNKEKAADILEKQLEAEAHPDVYLAMVNLEEDIFSRVGRLNKVLELYEAAPVYLKSRTARSFYDRLESQGTSNTPEDLQKAHKVTVIMPVYNAAAVIDNSLSSLQQQTWSNLEIIVVNDCSNDNTAAIVQSFMKKDARIKLIEAEANRGAYYARNLGLKEATGEFVTVNDADDWSHPEKIERQALHLVENPLLAANTSELARLTENLTVYRRGTYGTYLQPNFSSLMFRRERTMREIGYWDEVRFGADAEFIARLTKVLGKHALVHLQTGPLSFPRQAENSLTSSGPFGYYGQKMGARKEYADVYEEYHQTAANLKYEFPQRKRPFPVVEPMRPEREAKAEGRRKFDIVLVSDFRLPGPVNAANAEEIKALRRLGCRTALVQMAEYETKTRPIHPEIRALIDEEQVQLLVYGERASCPLMIVRNPSILEEKQNYTVDVKAEQIKVIIDDAENYTEKAALWQESLRNCFGKTGHLHPADDHVRNELEHQPIAPEPENWTSVIESEDWKRAMPPLLQEKIKIGCTSTALQQGNLPADADFEIRIYGNEKTLKNLSQDLSKNCLLINEETLTARNFLSTLDIFLGDLTPGKEPVINQTLIEAMAAGVPLIVSPIYQAKLGKAASYAVPGSLSSTVHRLMKEEGARENQAEEAYAYVSSSFSWQRYGEKLKSLMPIEQAN
ncbi:glycosyltransferase family A protein [Alkalicoccus daliensis]|uniref:Glycosyl transferase family 2 n=1 Tax=Alkalicoccus daliensis TaxID=745820 RepID=A0A1H0GJA0_9BACI|nr:glycosyltransferase family A protein [Alkalicoccus daliensis]SDO06948.1 Glycosyl transferase family 2 [Alkalicoccus daliensis]